MLTAIRLYGRDNGKTKWIFRCECGNEIIRQTDSVLWRTGLVHCGCQSVFTRLRKGKSRKRTADEIKNSEMNEVFRSYVKSARIRNLDFNLSKKYFISLLTQQCHYCGGLPRNGVDRINNSIGYSMGNCVPCCTICNRAKRDMAYLDFMNYIRRIGEFLNNRCDG